MSGCCVQGLFGTSVGIKSDICSSQYPALSAGWVLLHFEASVCDPVTGTEALAGSKFSHRHPAGSGCAHRAGELAGFYQCMGQFMRNSYMNNIWGKMILFSFPLISFSTSLLVSFFSHFLSSSYPPPFLFLIPLHSFLGFIFSFLISPVTTHP